MHKVHCKAILRHGGMELRDPPLTVSFDSQTMWNNVEDILTQWFDIQHIKKDFWCQLTFYMPV